MTIHELSAIERASIRAFVESCAEHFTGRVLDYGCGKQPYRDVVKKAGGQYVPADRVGWIGGSGGNIGNGDPFGDSYTAILCTQVVEYVPDVAAMLDSMHTSLLRNDGALVLTGPTCWPILPGHLHSHTPEGITRLLRDAGFTVERCELRATVGLFPLGYGAVARA